MKAVLRLYLGCIKASACAGKVNLTLTSLTKALSKALTKALTPTLQTNPLTKPLTKPKL